jgi:SAM-dependent methyltransferase
MSARALVHDRLNTLADPTRGRVLLMLEGHELTVSELCSILQLPQSTVSRHLRVLGDDEWIVSRNEGTSRYYGRNPRLGNAAERLWTVVRDDLLQGDAAEHDRARLAGVLAQRQSKSREFFAASAVSWDAVRTELFGVASEFGLFGLLDDAWVLGDLGAGTGRLSEQLAPYVAKVIAVDASPQMLAAARQRLDSVSNVEVRQGDLEALPIAAESLDAAMLSLVLHYTAEPARVFGETFRVLRAGGRAVVVDMLPHERVEYRQQMGHVWLGFSEQQMRDWLRESGFERIQFHRLPADPAAKGPTLFAVSARKPERSAPVVSPDNAADGEVPNHSQQPPYLN